MAQAGTSILVQLFNALMEPCLKYEISSIGYTKVSEYDVIDDYTIDYDYDLDPAITMGLGIWEYYWISWQTGVIKLGRGQAYGEGLQGVVALERTLCDMVTLTVSSAGNPLQASEITCPNQSE